MSLTHSLDRCCVGTRSRLRRLSLRSVYAANGLQPAPAQPEEQPDRGIRKTRTVDKIYAGTLKLETLLSFERKGHVVTRQLIPQPQAQALATPLLACIEARRLDAYRHRISILCPAAPEPSADRRGPPQRGSSRNPNGASNATQNGTPHTPNRTPSRTQVATVAEAQRLLRENSPDPVGFLQIFNLHRGTGEAAVAARALCENLAVAGAAAQLLGCRRVRLYQTCLFVKEPGMGETNWHSDLNMAPLDTNAFATVWLPLRDLAPSDAALEFASGSHRDFALPYWQTEEGMRQDLSKRGYAIEKHNNLMLGDATWHAGWTLHASPPQPPGRPPRAAMAVSFFADGARRLSGRHLRRKPHAEDALSYAEWLPEVKEGAVAAHALLPVVFDAGGRTDKQPLS